MQGCEGITTIRDAARAFEEALPPLQRKDLGQFFSGLLLGRVLAHLAIGTETKRVFDPMVGNGDLLDALAEAVAFSGGSLEHLDAIEIDEQSASMCRDRLWRIHGDKDSSIRVACGDAFDVDTYEELSQVDYDLVITNPPYVRYQALSGRADQVRQGLLKLVNQRLSGISRDIWRALASEYSGLADLSVPSWLLSALMVRQNGCLALVVPATWRSREYADVIRYLLLRCFRVELIVEDTQPGWFSDALVRTHLILARRLPEEEMTVPLNARNSWHDARWVQVAPEASSQDSLVGEAFGGEIPEADFAAWCFAAAPKKVSGITTRSFSLRNEWQALHSQAGKRRWLRTLEPTDTKISGVTQKDAVGAVVPEALHDLMPAQVCGKRLITLEDAGIAVGQGLRTGCNRFFYVHLQRETDDTCVRVCCDHALGSQILTVPVKALKPVLHRQADLDAWCKGKLPSTRVLDLRHFVLPEDMDAVLAVVRENERELPEILPDELAEHVRKAGQTVLDGGENARPISGMSAVRTNVRSARAGGLPRFWYMLPDFTSRHLPQAFVPRVIHEAPRVYGNMEPLVLVDANFSTFFTDDAAWTAAGLAAFLNSTWCRAVMEASGTPLAGGALKLEAAHLRKMHIPRLNQAVIGALNSAGKTTQEIDRIVLRALLTAGASDSEVDNFAQCLNERRTTLGSTRQRGTS